jgi:hypothetical protein
VTGSETVSGTLGVSGTSNLSGTNVTGVLAVTGSETVSGTLGVSGTSNLAGTNVTGTLAVTGSETVTGSVSAGTLSAIGSVSGGSLSVAGTIVDTSGNLVVVGTTSVKSLNVNGTGYVSGSVTLADNLAVLANEYLGGNMYANRGIVVGDSSNGTGVVFSVAPGTTVLSVTGSETVSGTLGVTGVSTLAGTNVTGTLAVTGSETVTGSLSAGSLSTTGAISGASVAVTGAVSGGSLLVAGTNVDQSGNLVVIGTTTVQSLLTNGAASFDDSVNVTGNESVQGGFYIDGGAYINNNFVVGDGSDNDGVTMHTSGTTLNIFGVTQDSSAIAFPITVNVEGSLGMSDPSGNTTTFSTVLDTSNNVPTLGLTLPTTVITGTTDGTAVLLPVVVNGTIYYMNLYPAKV